MSTPILSLGDRALTRIATPPGRDAEEHQAVPEADTPRAPQRAALLVTVRFSPWSDATVPVLPCGVGTLSQLRRR